MPHSTRWAKQLIRELPKNPKELLLPGRRNYTDPAFLVLFFEWLQQLIYEDPQAGLKWAEILPQLTQSETSSREDQITSHALLGAAYRAVGRHDEAEARLAFALELADSETVAPGTRADMRRRLANLRNCQGRSEEALELLEEVGRLDGLAGFLVLLSRGNALAALGRFPEAVTCYGQILVGMKLKSHPSSSSPEKRTHEAAVINLGYVVNEGAGPSSCWTALGYVARAKKRTPSRPSLPLYHLQWIEGLIWAKLQARGAPTGFSLALEAEKALKRALKGFLHLRVPWESALVGLDLAQLYRELGRSDDLLKLTLETLERFRILSGDTRAVAALGLIVDAVRAKENVGAVIVAAREAVRRQQQGGHRQPPSRIRLRATPAPPPIGRSNLALVQARKKLLAAAYEEIHHGFKLRGILKRASVNRATFYHHFGDLGGCAIAVVDEHMHCAVLDWLEQVDPADPLGSLAGVVELPLPLVPLPNGLAADPLERLSNRWRQGLADKLAQGQQEGNVRVDFDAEETAAVLIAGIATQDPVCIRGTLKYLQILRP